VIEMKNAVTFKIRPLRWNDFEDYCKIERLLQDELNKNPRATMGRYKQQVNWDYLITSFSELYKSIKLKRAKTLVLEINGKVVGLSSIIATESPHAQHIGDLVYYILRQYRGKGMGTKLVGEILKNIPRRYEIISAGTHKNNKASEALLKKFGFKKASLLPRFSKRGKTYLDVEEFYKIIK
jgi:L-amino acid N-acyltransferase YncA